MNEPSGRTARMTAAALVAAAVCIRIPDILSRPFHTDEAVNAHILGDLLSGAGYAYRPHDHHGPTLYWLVAGPMKIAGVSSVAFMEAWALRSVSVVCGAALVGAVYLLARKSLGESAALAAAAFVALAAPFVHFSGSFIHEPLLVLLSVIFAGLLWRWRETGERRLALAGGLVAGLMVATKETAPVILAAAGLAMIPGSPLPARRRLTGVALAGAVALATTAFFFSDFFRHPERLAALVDAVGLQTHRGLGAEHAHPWYTYILWLGSPGFAGLPWSGWLLAGFGLLGGVAGRDKPLVRACVVWATLLFVFHSALPYKTPWLTLSFLTPLVLPAGYGLVTALRRLPGRALPVAACAALAALLLSEGYVRCFRDDVSPNNPLAYSPTSRDTDRLGRDVAVALKKVGPGAAVNVVARDYWPLPWTLRHSPAGYSSEPGANLAPGFVLCGPEFLGEYSELAPFEAYEIRPGVTVFLSSGMTGKTNPTR